MNLGGLFEFGQSVILCLLQYYCVKFMCICCGLFYFVDVLASFWSNSNNVVDLLILLFNSRDVKFFSCAI